MEANNHEHRKITTIGKTDWRNTNQIFGIKDHDRLGHMYTIGKTGVGKSTLLLNMAIADIENGNGIAIIDPHGDIANSMLDYVPEHRTSDVVYFNAADFAFPICFNPFADIQSSNHHLVTSSLISTFRKIWSEFWGPRLEHILRFSILTLLQYPGSTLLDIQPLLTDMFLRRKVLSTITNPHILAFWQNEFDKYSPSLRAEAIAPILNKTGLFLASTPVRNMVGQKESAFHMQDILDEGKILICNLSKGQIGEDACALLGSMLLTSIQMAALQRAGVSENERRPFYLYVDEMHSFLSLSFADILSEARKYGLSLFLTHQYIEQLDERIRSAIFGNVGTIISFRVGAHDAGYLAREFYPLFAESDFINLPKYSIYLRLLIDGVASKPFSAVTLPLKPSQASYKEQIIASSRNRYAKTQREIEANILHERQGLVSHNGEENSQPGLFV